MTSAKTEAGCSPVPLDPLVRAQFEAWANKQWGQSAWKHTSNCCGEWDAWQAAALAEREACANVCEKFEDDMGYGKAQKCADAIRMRSNAISTPSGVQHDQA